MVARHCSQIARKENRLGRHYSRFHRLLQTQHERHQWLAKSKIVKIAIGAIEWANFG
jgi:hypothetical protein